MGRKIPAKKHRGVKDPLQQQAKRLRSLKGKINAPPTDPDEQPVPRSVMRLFDLTPKNKPVTKPKPKLHHTEVRPKPMGVSLRRAEGESSRGFSLRINSALRQIKDPTDYEDIQAEDRYDHRGQRIAELREKRKKKLKKAARSSSSSSTAAGSTGQQQTEGDELNRKQRRRREQQEKKKAKEADKLQSQSEVRYERVSFGDRVDAPPSLPKPRLKPKPAVGGLPATATATAPIHTQRPCGRRGLLLEAMLR